MDIKFSRIKLIIGSIIKLPRHVKVEDLQELEKDLEWALNMLKIKWVSRLKDGSKEVFEAEAPPVSDSVSAISLLLKHKSKE